MNTALIASAFMLGLAGSGHCVAMCGGASGWVLRMVSPQAGSLARFHLGRVAGYALMGLLAALAGHELQRAAGWSGALRPLWTMANAAAFVLGASLLITGRQPAVLDRFGQWVGRRLLGLGVLAGRTPRPAVIQPSAAIGPARPEVFAVPLGSIGRADGRPMRRDSRAPALATGACWSLMPCGLLYSALMLVGLSGDAAGGGLAMAAFAAASAMPMLLAQRLFGRTGWLRRWERTGNRLIGAGICALAGWGLYMVATGQGQGLFCLPGA